MTEPWQGDGPDPWLPDRIAYAIEAAVAEEAIRAQVWTELSAWLVSVRRAVLGAIRPDPNMVWSQVPAWEAAIQRIIAGSIHDTMGIVYAETLGDNYRFDNRPFVVDHLAQVTNRMIRTPDSVFDLIASEIAAGANDGESIPGLARRVDNVLSTTGTERWRNRATVVARTETLGALNAARTDVFALVAETLGAEYEQVWISTLDKRTRASHRSADGQRVPVGTPFTVGGASLRYPGDPYGPGKETVQCRCSTIMTEVGETVDVSRRQMLQH
jgi:hypothetical protein